MKHIFITISSNLSHQPKRPIKPHNTDARMRVSKAPIFRTSLRPTFRQDSRIQPATTRLATTSSNTGPGGQVGDKGTAKEYHKDGTNPNKNVMYEFCPSGACKATDWY